MTTAESGTEERETRAERAAPGAEERPPVTERLASATEENKPTVALAVSSDWPWFAAIVALTFVFLAIAGYPRQWSLGLLVNDEFWYAHLARSLYEGAGYVTNALHPIQAPRFDTFPVPEEMKQSGYSLITAAAWLLTGVSVRVMLVIAAAGMALFSGMIFLLARHLGWGRGIASFIAAVTVVNPVVVRFGVGALPESLYFAFFTLIVLLVLRGTSRSVVGAAALNAALIVIKGHGIIYVPVFVGYLWLSGAGSLAAGFRPDGRKLRVAATYVGVLLLTLVVAAVVLPDGAVQIFEASGTYSHTLMIETGRSTSTLAYREIAPVDPWTYILEHPAEYVEKVARQVRRTKVILEDLGGPALGGILFPCLLLCGILLLASAGGARDILPDSPVPPRDAEPYLLFAALVAMTFLFFWPLYVVTRFFVQTLPLMVLLCMYVLARLATLARGVAPRLRTTLAAAAVVYFVAYPAAATVWVSYRNPLQYVGTQLAVRFLDFSRMSGNVRDRLPADPVIVTDMAHEITWFTGARTILFPNTEADLERLVEQYDVDALYEHPLNGRDWPSIRERFTLVDSADGFLWVRRRAP